MAEAPVRVEEAVEGDIEALCGLLSQLFEQEVEFTADTARQRRALRTIIGSPDVGQILVARDGARIVGMVSLLFTTSTATGGRVAMLEDMVVDRGARGAGVGSTLMRCALEAARALGCERITLLTDLDNRAAQRFYARHGFSRSGMIPMRRVIDDALDEAKGVAGSTARQDREA